MNAHVFAFSPDPGQDRSRVDRAPEPGADPSMAALPEREWGLSAGQVAAVVVVILAAAEVIGALF